VRYNLALLHHRIALTHLEAGETGAALQALERALVASQELAALPNANQRYLYELGTVQGAIGNIHRQQGNLNTARKAYEVHVRTLEDIVRADPQVPKNRRGLAEAYAEMAEVERQSHNCAAATEWFQKALSQYNDLRKAGMATETNQKDAAEIAKRLTTCR
jgi:tetratricopeptide (TPR) repeat protein